MMFAVPRQSRFKLAKAAQLKSQVSQHDQHQIDQQKNKANHKSNHNSLRSKRTDENAEPKQQPRVNRSFVQLKHIDFKSP